MQKDKDVMDGKRWWMRMRKGIGVVDREMWWMSDGKGGDMDERGEEAMGWRIVGGKLCE